MSEIQQVDHRPPTGTDYPQSNAYWKPPGKEGLLEIRADVLLFILQKRLQDYTVKCYSDGSEPFYEISYEAFPFAYAFMTDSQSLLFRVDEDGDGLFDAKYDSDRDRSILEERLVPTWIREREVQINRVVSTSSRF